MASNGMMGVFGLSGAAPRSAMTPPSGSMGGGKPQVMPVGPRVGGPGAPLAGNMRPQAQMQPLQQMPSQRPPQGQLPPAILALLQQRGLI